ncbi:MAG: hypothetical protein COC24_007215 [Alphaproteobacteria bacterium]|nr:hypothetical protein [Alphaproteobacteria bacterium]
MKTQDLMRQLDGVDAEEIGAIEGDVVGSSLFVNILLSVGAFFASSLILIAILSFLWGTLTFDEDYFWMHLSLVAGLMIFMGYKSHSTGSVFALRLSTYFMIFGKLALIGLVFERISAMIGYNDFFENLRLYAPLAVLLAIGNMYVGRIKLEIFTLLVITICGLKYVARDWLGMATYFEFDTYLPFPFDFVISSVLWIWAVVMLLRFDTEYKNRLPFYALTLSLLILAYADESLFTRVPELMIGRGTQIAYNLLLLAPSVYLALKLLKSAGYRLSWQYIVVLLLLLAGAILPIDNLYIILFCFVFGYSRRDRYVIVMAYILTPAFIYQLYHSFDLTLDSASLLAMVVGVGLLVAWAVVRYSKFEKVA